MAKLTKKLAVTRGKRAPNKEGWQAEKSAMTRHAILNAAVQCLIDVGYASTTTTLIAESAGVSRGAMMHHFPSRAAVLDATLYYLHEKRMDETRRLVSKVDVSAGVGEQTRIKQFVKVAWDYICEPSSTALVEVLVASRSDKELQEVLLPLEKEFDQQFASALKEVFPHWHDVETANHMVRAMISGLILTKMKIDKEGRANKILQVLADSLGAANFSGKATDNAR